MEAGSHIIVEDSRFVDCGTAGGGGAICMFNDGVDNRLTARRVTMLRCISEAGGGGGFIAAGVVTLMDTQFIDCTAVNGGMCYLFSTARVSMSGGIIERCSNHDLSGATPVSAVWIAGARAVFTGVTAIDCVSSVASPNSAIRMTAGARGQLSEHPAGESDSSAAGH